MAGEYRISTTRRCHSFTKQSLHVFKVFSLLCNSCLLLALFRVYIPS